MSEIEVIPGAYDDCGCLAGEYLDITTNTCAQCPAGWTSAKYSVGYPSCIFSCPDDKTRDPSLKHWLRFENSAMLNYDAVTGGALGTIGGNPGNSEPSTNFLGQSLHLSQTVIGQNIPGYFVVDFADIGLTSSSWTVSLFVEFLGEISGFTSDGTSQFRSSSTELAYFFGLGGIEITYYDNAVKAEIYKYFTRSGVDSKISQALSDFQCTTGVNPTCEPAHIALTFDCVDDDNNNHCDSGYSSSTDDFTKSKLTFYIDGVQKLQWGVNVDEWYSDTTPQDDVEEISRRLHLGINRDYYFVNYYYSSKAKYDDLRIYDRVLPATEIQALANQYDPAASSPGTELLPCEPAPDSGGGGDTDSSVCPGASYTDFGSDRFFYEHAGGSPTRLIGADSDWGADTCLTKSGCTVNNIKFTTSSCGDFSGHKAIGCDTGFHPGHVFDGTDADGNWGWHFYSSGLYDMTFIDPPDFNEDVPDGDWGLIEWPDEKIITTMQFQTYIGGTDSQDVSYQQNGPLNVLSYAWVDDKWILISNATDIEYPGTDNYKSSTITFSEIYTRKFLFLVTKIFGDRITLSEIYIYGHTATCTDHRIVCSDGFLAPAGSTSTDDCPASGGGGGLPSTPDHSCAINTAALAGRNVSTFKVRSAAGAASNASFAYFALENDAGGVVYQQGKLAAAAPFIEPSASDGVTAQSIAGTNDKYFQFEYNDAQDVAGQGQAEYTLTVEQDTEFDILIVGGGGAAGFGIGGGGGAGGVVYVESFVLTGGRDYKVRVGNGGKNSDSITRDTVSTPGESGSSSGIYDSTGTTAVEYTGHGATFALKGYGGGGGGGYNEGVQDPWNDIQPRSGGSSGGIGPTNPDDADLSGGITAEQGNTLWNGTSFDRGGYLGGAQSKAQYAAAGGGGAGGEGHSALDSDNAGDGGPGIVNDITGTLQGYAAGGGGSTDSATATNRGYGGSVSIGGVITILGGNGLAYTSSSHQSVAGGDGPAHTGSGGGGGGWDYVPQLPGDGGSGVVIVRYRFPAAGGGGADSGGP